MGIDTTENRTKERVSDSELEDEFYHTNYDVTNVVLRFYNLNMTKQHLLYMYMCWNMCRSLGLDVCAHIPFLTIMFVGWTFAIK